AGIPLHQDEVWPGLLQTAVKRRHLAAVRWESSPGDPLRGSGKSDRRLGRVDLAGLRRRPRQYERHRGEERREENPPPRRTHVGEQLIADVHLFPTAPPDRHPWPRAVRSPTSRASRPRARGGSGTDRAARRRTAWAREGSR